MKNKNFLNETLTFFLMAMLVFSISFMAASVEANVETENAKSDIEDAKHAARKDAKSFSELEWFAGSCLGGALPYPSMFFLLYAGFDAPEICFFSLMGAGMLLPTGYAIFHSPTPRAERLLGKSSDYVDAYTTVYRKRVKLQRIALSATGCIVGTCLGVYSLNALIPESYDTED
jgi:hypothetical protein